MVVALIVVVTAVFGGALVIGFAATSSLVQFRPEASGPTSTYESSVDQLRTAVLAAAEVSHGMRVVDHNDGAVLISTYPTPMHMYGSFGLFIRCRFEPSGDSARMILDASPKVGWAAGRIGATLHEFELVLRKALRSRMGVEAKIDFGAGEAVRRPASPAPQQAVDVEQTSRTTQVAAGWYVDATDPTMVRWWDGDAWTSHVRQVQ